jgi:hypothetical protein
VPIPLSDVPNLCPLFVFYGLNLCSFIRQINFNEWIMMRIDEMAMEKYLWYFWTSISSSFLIVDELTNFFHSTEMDCPIGFWSVWTYWLSSALKCQKGTFNNQYERTLQDHPNWHINKYK